MNHSIRWTCWQPLTLALVTLLLPATLALAAGTPSADEILTSSRARPDGKDIYSDVKLILVDEKGGERTRDLLYLQKDDGANEKLTLYFTGPRDVKGVGFQTMSYDEATAQDDDQWIYLPAFRQVRRIASSDKRGSFMGSEFAYVDLDKLRVRDYEQRLVGQGDVLGRDCYLIERVPRSAAVIGKAGYYKTQVWVDKSTYIVLRQTYYDAKGILFKEMLVKRLEQVQGVWTVMQSDMLDFVSKRKSTLIFSNVRYDVGLSDQLFQRDVLKTGVHSGSLPSLH